MRRLISIVLTALTIVAWFGFAKLPSVGPQPRRSGGTTIPVARPTESDQATKHYIIDKLDRLPLSFVPNHEQGDSPVKFVASVGNDFKLALTATGAHLTWGKTMPNQAGNSVMPVLGESGLSESGVRRAELKMRFLGAHQNTSLIGIDELPGKSNYFIGTDPGHWRLDVPHYAKVQQEGLYPGVDVIYYGSKRQLEYDFIVAPGADAEPIRFAFDGAQNIFIDAAGDLILQTPTGDLTLRKPVAYQEVDGIKKEVSATYTIGEANDVTFEIGQYDSNRCLVIDPAFGYSTFIGGIENDQGLSVAVDTSGCAYITGGALSADFPVANPIESGIAGAFITKLDAKGETLIYSTVIGSASSFSVGTGIAVDSDGNAYVSGAASQGFPTSPGAYDGTPNGRYDVFALKLNSAGNQLLYSTLIGPANDLNQRNSIAIDSQGHAYVTGESGFPFPTTPGPFQGVDGDDVFITEVNGTGSDLIYSALLGGSNRDVGADIVVDELGNAYVTGNTSSPDFPLQNALQPTFGGFSDAFVIKMNSGGSSLAYSTYLGGSGGQFYGDMGTALAIDRFHNVYVGGRTESADFPVTPGAFQTAKVGLYNAFITKLNSEGNQLVYSTYFGGGAESVTAMAVDEVGNCCSAGWALSNTPLTADAMQSAPGGGADVYVAKLNATGTALNYSSYLGGSGFDEGTDMALDQFANVYVVGRTVSENFPVTRGSFDRKHSKHPAGFTNEDVFVTKLLLGPPKITSATLSGKKLFVLGGNFDEGAKVLVNGEQQKTANDEEDPAGKLRAKKAGKNIIPGVAVVLQVRNSDGTLSNEFGFTR